MGLDRLEPQGRGLFPAGIGENLRAAVELGGLWALL